MRILRASLFRIVGLFGKPRRDNELDAEIEANLALHIDDNIRAGMTPAEARRQALLKFGSVESAKERYRDRRGIPFLETTWQDVRFTLRMLRKSPGFTTVAILTLALGIGANTAIFTLVNGILLEPLPFAHPSRLVSLTDTFPKGAFVAMRHSIKTMNVAAYRDGDSLNLTGLGEPVRLYGMEVSANFFSLLGVRPELGRTFLDGEDEPGRNSKVILSHALWQQEFGSDPNVIGRSAMLEGASREIVGVMPQDFHFGSQKAQFWAPLDLDPREVGSYWGGGFMPIVGRLRPGTTLGEARAEFRGMIPRLRSSFPWRMPDALWAASTVIPLRQDIVGNVTAKLLILLGAIGLVLIIACVNIANLLLTRAATRQREMAVRAALGAGRARICRQLLTESLIIAAGGGLIGLLLAMEGLSWLKLILPSDTPRLSAVSLDWTVLAFTAVLALLTALVFGFAPALHASRVDLSRSFKTGRQHSDAAGTRLRNALASAEVAFAVVVVIGAGLLIRSLWTLSHVDPGFRTQSIVAARITPNEDFCRQLSRCQAFYRELIARVDALPGVRDAAIVNAPPLTGTDHVRAFAADVEGHPRNPRDPAPTLLETAITPGYLRLMGIPILQGRAFAPADSAPNAPPVALVTAATARKYWPNQSPIGKHVKPVFDKSWITIVGVVGDVTISSLAAKWPDWVDGAIYEPYGNGRGALLPADMTLVASLNGPSGFADELRGIVAGLNADAPVSDVQTMRRIVSQSMAAPRSMTSLFVVFAALALILGMIGIYGVISYSVQRRVPEIGVRKALGARNLDITKLVLAQCAPSVLLGIGIGLLAAFCLTRLMASLLYGIGTTDPLTYVAVSVLVAVIALVAGYIPARRAMRVDPVIALRCE